MGKTVPPCLLHTSCQPNTKKPKTSPVPMLKQEDLVGEFVGPNNMLVGSWQDHVALRSYRVQ